MNIDALNEMVSPELLNKVETDLANDICVDFGVCDLAYFYYLNARSALEDNNEIEYIANFELLSNFNLITHKVTQEDFNRACEEYNRDIDKIAEALDLPTYIVYDMLNKTVYPKVV